MSPPSKNPQASSAFKVLGRCRFQEFAHRFRPLSRCDRSAIAHCRRVTPSSAELKNLHGSMPCLTNAGNQKRRLPSSSENRVLGNPRSPTPSSNTADRSASLYLMGSPMTSSTTRHTLHFVALYGGCWTLSSCRDARPTSVSRRGLQRAPKRFVSFRC